MLATLLAVTLMGLPAPSGDVAVVCPAEFRAALKPWEAHRNRQGYSTHLVNATGTAEEIRARIRAVARDGNLKAVVLVGDVPVDTADAATRARGVPTFALPAKVNRYWGGDRVLHSDNPYADLDDDRVPEVSIGRLSADSAAELEIIVRKILDYERNQDFGPWRQRVNLVAGEGGFGAAVDRGLEFAARKLITNGVPPEYNTSVTFASWRSMYCPNPHEFHSQVLQRFNEGCLFWVFMGHGAPRTLQWASFPDHTCPILRCEDCNRLVCGSKPPIAFFLACHTGALAARDDCLAEDLLRAPAGPVAVFSGSNVTMPYAMSALGREAMRECFVSRRATLGEVILHAKRGTVAGYEKPIWSLVNAVLNAVAPARFQPKEERYEHLQLFNLFGDPLLRLRHPQPVELQVSRVGNEEASAAIRVTATSATNGTATVELVRRRDTTHETLVERNGYYPTAAGREEFATTYAAANTQQLTSVTGVMQNGKLLATLPVPAHYRGSAHVRVIVQGAGEFAVGSSDIEIGAPAE